MLKLLIADESEEFCNALADMLSAEYEIVTCGRGTDAIRCICAFDPDLLVLDLALPGLEGISVLQQAAEYGSVPKVLATTWYVTDYIQMLLTNLNVKYLVRKPCDLGAMVLRLREMVEMAELEDGKGDRFLLISNVLLKLGFSAKLDGYSYLCSAIGLAMDFVNPRVTKDIYPALAKEFHVSCQQVERAVSRAIEKAYRTGNMRIWGRYFAQDAMGKIPCPTNGEFIFALANRLRIREDTKS